MNRKFVGIAFLTLFFAACSGGGGGVAPLTDDGGGGSETVMSCPSGFVLVPALAGYTTADFCVSKYEMKNDGEENAVSQATGTPYVSINRDNSIAKCQALGSGYDLMTNDEWQTVARNIELVAENWDTETIGSVGGLSRGHSDDIPSNALAASSDDNEGCHGTNQTCNGSTWDSQRRTHRLSNGEVVWDIAGNVYEWVKDDNTNNYGSFVYISQITAVSHTEVHSLSGGTTTTARNAKDQFGPSGDYSSLDSGNYGGLGYGYVGSSAGAVLRGGSWNNGALSGVFMADLTNGPSSTVTTVGFRCASHP